MITRRRHPTCRSSSHGLACSVSWRRWRRAGDSPGQDPSDALSPPGEDYTPIISALVANGLPYVCAAFDLTERFPPLAGAAPYHEVQQPLPITYHERRPPPRLASAGQRHRHRSPNLAHDAPRASHR